MRGEDGSLRSRPEPQGMRLHERVELRGHNLPEEPGLILGINHDPWLACVSVARTRARREVPFRKATCGAVFGQLVCALG